MALQYKDDSLSAIKYGCQTYTWQMSYARYSQRLDHIMDVAAESGFTGIEPEICMLGRYKHDPRALAADLQRRGLALGALCLVCDWLSPQESLEERTEADRVIACIRSHFPGTLLALCQMPQDDRSSLRERQANCLACCRAIGSRAADQGIQTAFHPNSPPGSVFRTAEDYAVLMDGLAAGPVGFAPDAGHIARGGMSPVEIFAEYAPLIRHVHFKDMNAESAWVEMGQGCIDFAGIIKALDAQNYNGWIMIEDESSRAEVDPDEVTRLNGRYVGNLRSS